MFVELGVLLLDTLLPKDETSEMDDVSLTWSSGSSFSCSCLIQETSSVLFLILILSDLFVDVKSLLLLICFPSFLNLELDSSSPEFEVLLFAPPCFL